MPAFSERVNQIDNKSDRQESARSFSSAPEFKTGINGQPSNWQGSVTPTSKDVVNLSRLAVVEACDSVTSTGAQYMIQKYHREYENQCDLVPPLDLDSVEEYSTQNDYSYSYNEHCESAKKMINRDKAFDTWLSAKKKSMTKKDMLRKKADEKKREEQEARKRKAEAKYQEWLDSKARQQTRSREQLKPTNSQGKVNDLKPKTKTSNCSLNGRDKKSQEKLNKWENDKRLESERRRQLKQQQEEKRAQMEQQRREMSSGAWKKWMINVASKPKPVPLNRGIFTLRGTVSNIFVNPNEWNNDASIEQD